MQIANCNAPLLVAALLFALCVPLRADEAPPTAVPSAAQASEPVPEAKPAAPVELPWQLRPYNVLISVGFAEHPSFDAGFRAGVLHVVHDRLRARLGQMWDMTLAEDELLLPVSRNGLERLSAEQLNARFLPAGHDKVFLVGIEKAGSRYAIYGREWDGSSQSVGPVAGRDTFDRRLVADALAAQIHELFRPLATLTAVDNDVAEMLIRAGEYLPADPSAAQFEPGDMLTNFQRYLDRKREVRRIQSFPWTYFSVLEVDRARMTCAIISAFRSPIAGSRRRVDVLGLAARPVVPQTELKLVPRSDHRNPLIGVRVDVLDRLPTKDDPVDERLGLVTDRRGVVAVPAHVEQPLRYLLVQSGQSTLARVPCIPGLEPALTLEVPDDTGRLTVEGELAVLQGELIDIVSRRAVLMARAKQAARVSKWQEADQFSTQLDALPDLQKVEQRLSVVRLQGVQTAEKNGDRVAKARVQRMCADIAALATRHLDPEKAKQFREEMQELRAASK
jgi:hypothetical protein